MSFPPYPEYRDSGIEWLGELPSHWGIKALKRLACIEMGQSPSADEVNADGIGIPFLQGCAEFGNSHPRPTSYCATPRKTAREGDLLLSVRAPVGSLNRANQPYGIGRGLCAVRAQNNDFAHYLLVAVTPALRSIATGSTYEAVSVDDVANLILPFPSDREQRAIAAFLDRETARIDAAVAAQERLIALLAEKRAATISHAVTKGLDPHAPMKDSGIEWLGQIPAAWEAKRLRFLCTIETGDGDTQDASDEGDYPFFVRSPNVERINRFSFDCEAVMTSGDGAGVGKIYHHHAGKFTAHQRVYVFHDFSETLPRLVYYYFQTFFARVALQGTAKSTVESLRRPMLADFWVSVPERNVQQAILEYCDETDQRYAAAVEKCEGAIVLLRERRAALISAAVTGKIDVRGVVAENNVISLNDARDARAQTRVRAVVGAYAIARLGKLGRMAVMKGGFLAEAHAGISELEGRYERKAAGPYCRALIEGMERGARQDFGMRVQEGERVTYSIPPSFTAPSDELRSLIGSDRADRFLGMLTLLEDFSRQGVEAIATLYAAWNDLLATATAVADEEIIAEVLTNWDVEKAEKFTAADLEHWIAWMRRNNLVPDGSAPHTDHQGVLL